MKQTVATFQNYAKEDIYEKEENYQFVLWQSWSGEENNSAEINRIREAAKRNLLKYPNIIRDYWEPYTIGHIAGDNIKFAQVYMPFETLIEITKTSGLENDPDIKERIEAWQQNIQNKTHVELFTYTKTTDTLKAKFKSITKNMYSLMCIPK